MMKPCMYNMSKTSFNDYANTASSPEKTNVYSTHPQSNTSVTCSRLRVSQWLMTKSNEFKIGPNLAKSATSNPSLVLQTFTKDLLMDILLSLSHSLGLRAKASPGISLRSAEMHSISLNSLSLLPQSLLTGFLPFSGRNRCLWLCPCCHSFNLHPQWQTSPHSFPLPNFHLTWT